MSKELLHHGDTTANTYIDPGAETREAYEISKKSRTLARSIVGNENREDRIRQRCSVAVGDFGMADLMRFSLNPVAATLSALLRSAPIITDIRMVQVGIQKKGHSSEILCALDFGAEIAHARGITRSSAGFFALKEKLSDRLSLLAMHPLLSCPCAKWLKRGYALR
jgi:precorrin-8X/cobalt-precorrin-8 methylmutase